MSDSNSDALEYLERRLVSSAPYSPDRLLQNEILLYIARELRELRSLIDAIDRGRSEW